MKKEILQVTKAVILGLVLSVGVGYISAAWSNPPGAPPTCNDVNIPGCNAPVNVGPATQAKPGLLILNGLTTSVLRLTDGNQAAGKVLTSDANGLATWATSTSGGNTSSGRVVFGNYQTQALPNTNVSTAVTVAGLTSGATGIIAFVNSNASCTDASAAWQIYTMSDVQIAGIGARVGGGESISAQDFQIMIPVTNSQFKYLTQGNCSGTLTVVGQIL